MTRRRVIRGLAALVAGVLLVAGGYVSYAAVRHARTVVLPVAAGPYQAGRTAVEWTDDARTDPLAPTAGTPRRLSVWLWYPVAAGTAGRPAPYAPGPWAGLHLPPPAGWGETDFDAVRTGVLTDAPVAAGRFPVVVLEPGLGLSAPQYSGLAGSLARHGYLVAGVTPTYSANLTVLGGTAVPATRAGNPPDLGGHAGDPGRRADDLVAVWAADARFVATRVSALGHSGPFSGHIDAGHVAYVGHSFGGAASLEACRTDPGCAGAADLDGTQFGTVVRLGLTAPMLILGHENSCVTGTCAVASADDSADLAVAQSLIARSRGPIWTFTIDGTAHFDFTDYATYYLAAPLRRVVALGSLGGRGSSIIDACLTAFLDRAVRGRAEPLLTTASDRYPEVRIGHLPS
jgi:hypothetical protein